MYTDDMYYKRYILVAMGAVYMMHDVPASCSDKRFLTTVFRHRLSIPSKRVRLVLTNACLRSDRRYPPRTVLRTGRLSFLKD